MDETGAEESEHIQEDIKEEEEPEEKEETEQIEVTPGEEPKETPDERWVTKINMWCCLNLSSHTQVLSSG